MKTCPKCGGAGVIADASEMRKARIETGASIRTFAAYMEISAQYLCDLELDRRQWSDALLRKWEIARQMVTKGDLEGGE